MRLLFHLPLSPFSRKVRLALGEKRIPFDMPEGESEIIGYNVEYSGMKFGMFLMADFVETVVVAGMTTALFLGGWQVPWLFRDGFHLPGGLVLGPASQNVAGIARHPSVGSKGGAASPSA